MTTKLEEIVLINESSVPDLLGDVSLFRSIHDAERYLEPIDVQNGEYFAYLLDGHELVLLVEENRVKILCGDRSDSYMVRVRGLLEAAAKNVISARERGATLPASIGSVQMPLDQLVAAE